MDEVVLGRMEAGADAGVGRLEQPVILGRRRWIESVRFQTVFQLADLLLIGGQVDERLEVVSEQGGRVWRIAAVGVQVHRTLGDGVVEQHDDGHDVVVGRLSLTHVRHPVAGHEVAQALGHQFDALGRDLQRHFRRFLFLFLLLQVPDHHCRQTW